MDVVALSNAAHRSSDEVSFTTVELLILVAFMITVLECLPIQAGDALDCVKLPDMCGGTLADGADVFGKSGQPDHVLGQHLVFGNAWVDAQASRFRKAGGFRGCGHNNWLANAHQPDGNARGFSSGGVAPKIALLRISDAQDSARAEQRLKRSRQILRDEIAGNQ